MLQARLPGVERLIIQDDGTGGIGGAAICYRKWGLLPSRHWGGLLPEEERLIIQAPVSGRG